MSGSPWADPSTPTVPGQPYAGPPPTAPYAPSGSPQPWAQPGPWTQTPWAQTPWGPTPWAQTPPWGPPPGGRPPARPQRPGQLITAAVLAFAQAVVVLIASLYLWLIASITGVAFSEAGAGPVPGELHALTVEGTVLAIVQLLSAAVLVAAGVWALGSRRRAAWLLLVGALAVQVVLAGYWAVRLQAEVGGSGSGGAIAAFALFFAAGPLVGLGMLLTGPARRWFGDPPPAAWPR